MEIHQRSRPAGIAESPETADFTSAQDRIVARPAKKQQLESLGNYKMNPQQEQHCLARAQGLCEIKEKALLMGQRWLKGVQPGWDAFISLNWALMSAAPPLIACQRPQGAKKP